MVEILNDKEKNILFNDIMFFYDLFSCSQLSGNEIVIKLSKKLGKITYSDLGYTTFDKEDFKLYFKKERLLIGVILELLRDFQEIYVFNYGDKWMTNKKISPILNRFFKDGKIFNDKDSVLKFTEEQEIVALVKSIFRYNTFASICIPKLQIVITPTDHLDVFISSKKDYSNEIKKIIKNKSESEMFYLTKKAFN